MKLTLLGSRLCTLLIFASLGCMHKPSVRTGSAEGFTPYDSAGSNSKTDGPNYVEKSSKARPSMAVAQAEVPMRNPISIVTSLAGKEHHRDDIFYVNEYAEPFVKKWEDYFLGRGRRHMEKYLDRLPRYEALMKNILKEEGVPEELIYIALIESGFNSKAYSSASAVGYWQFIRGTGKYYGLKQNWLVDERRDPIYSTRAAAQYFKALYHAFGSWHLAMSSYNAGEHRVLRAIMGNVSREFWHLHEKKQLPRETLNYVPKFIAAAKIASNPKKYGFSHSEGQEPFSYESIKIDKSISLSKLASNLGVSSKEIKRLNPTFKTDLAPVYRGNFVEVRVPAGVDETKAILAAKKSYSTKKFYASEGNSYHRVRRGDSLYRIAKRYGTSVGTLKRLNGLSSRSIIYPGKKIKLPGSGGGRSQASASVNPNAKTYKVRRGDSLWTIAKKFGTSISNLKRINNLYSTKLRVGQVLRLSSNGASKGKAKTYYVKRGDNLTEIARKYRVSLSSLLKANGLSTRSVLHVGKRIRIPN